MYKNINFNRFYELFFKNNKLEEEKWEKMKLKISNLII